MDDNKSGVLLPVSILLGCVALAVGISVAKPQPVNVNVGGDTNPTPVVVSGNSDSQPQAGGVYGAGRDYTTIWDSGTFTGDLTVQDHFEVTGTTYLAGAVTLNGGVTLSSGSITDLSGSTFTSVSTSVTGATSTYVITPTRPIIVYGSAFFAASTTNGGVQRISVGTSTGAWVTSTSPFMDTSFTVTAYAGGNAAVTSTFNTTSTILNQNGYWPGPPMLVLPGVPIVFKSSSTTLVGSWKLWYQ